MTKTILITGSTDGIGKLAAIKLGKAGHQVIVHGRNPEKVANTVKEIEGNTKGYVADLTQLSAVKKMAADIKQDYAQLDVLINNAGVFKSAKPVTNDGLDIRFVVNHLAPYLLTEELLPVMEHRESRIINLSSAAQAPVSLAALRGEVALSDQTAYAQSKLALTMWSMTLAAEHKDKVVIPVNPGSLLNTNMVREAYGRHWSSADKGANILYDLATSEEYEGSTGQYFDNDLGDPKGRFGQAHTDAYDADMTQELIAVTRQLIESMI